jgi:WD40 repeat protein
MKPMVSTDIENFYVVGGTMRHDAPSYVERQADKELFSELQRNQFCHVLTARQMGKSSLMLRTAARLRDSGVNVAVLDLTAIGQNLTPEQWYSGLVLQLGERLDVEDQVFDFWIAHTHLGPMQRWIEALRKVVLLHIIGQLVIFIDEIDAVRSLNFSTDEFFAGIRECYNLRQIDEEMKRLTFCLIGVATPSDLIRDTRTTPFNIGTRIELNDFTNEEALSLADGLRYESQQNHATLRRIIYWTSGHPYLTQRVCQTIIQRQKLPGTVDVNNLIEELFFSKQAHDNDDNLIFVQERLLRSGADLTALLNLYGKVRRGKTVQDIDSDPLISILRLSGITRGEKGLLRVRNRIYAHVFDLTWVTKCLPDFEVRRQREAYRRGVWRTASVSSIILLVVIGFAVMAFWQRNIARDQEEINRHLLYMTQMKLINQEWENANVSRVEELLEATKPIAGHEDLRGFEWSLFYNDVHREAYRFQELESIVNVKFLKDKKTLAIGMVSRSNISNEREYSIKLYDRETGHPISSFQPQTKTGFDVVVFSPDQQYVATDSPENKIVLWELKSGNRIKEFATENQRSVRVVAFTPEQTYLVSGDSSGTLRLWDIATQRLKWTTKIKGPIIDLAVSPDGRLVAIATETAAVQILDIKTEKIVQPFSIKSGTLTHVFFSPDNNLLASTAQDGSLYLWDIRSRHILPFVPNHSKEIFALAFAPDGKTLATGSVDRTIKLWSLSDKKEIQTIRGHGSKVNSLDWSDDGKYLVSGASDGTIKIWDVFAKELPLLPNEKVNYYPATAFSPANEFIALGIAADKHIKLWNLSTGQQLSDLGEKHDEILYAVFSKDTRMVAISYGENLVEVYEVSTGKRLKRLPDIKTPVKGLSFSPDGGLLATGIEKEKLKLWALADESTPILLDSGNNDYCTTFSPDGKFLASTDGDGAIRLWDIASVSIIKTFRGHKGMIRSLAFSPDGRLLASGSNDQTIRLWNVLSGQESAKPVQADTLFRLAFTLDGKRLITGGEEGSITLWNTTDMQEVLTLKGVTGQVTSITFSSDGTTLAASSKGGNIKVWQAASLNK